MKTILISWLLTISALLAAQQPEDDGLQYEIGDEEKEFMPFFESSRYFSVNIPHEKVYLHFDNTSYYQYDNIRFKCYLVTSGDFQLSPLSKTLYVELLNTGGEILDKRILKVENGQCHGEFTLNHLPFYSGFYEVRAYTKYMLNFGDDVIFSRLLPVFNKPQKEGDWEERKMFRYTKWSPYPMKRAQQEKGDKVNVRFFPEGGHLVQGVASKVAFEATDETGNPIEITGIVTDGLKQEAGRLITMHEGRGVFFYTPVGGRDEAVAEVEFEGKKYRFDLPESRPTGVVMEVDNLTHPDSVVIAIRRNEQTPPDLFGIDVISGNKPQQTAYFAFTENRVTYLQIDKKSLSSGVSQIVLFNKRGDVLCDRLLFTYPKERLDIKVTANKPVYNPRELVEMDFRITDNKDNPVQTTFSLSVRDGTNEVECHNTILTDLLLMSDIKGYVRNPSYYFEVDEAVEESQLTSDSASFGNHTNERASRLDLLLMVQGWRRYVWKQMAGVEPFEPEPLYYPEQAIEIHGTVVSFVRKKPMPDVDVSLFLMEKGKKTNEIKEKAIELFKTDELGRFAFMVDVKERWDMIISVMEKNKRKDHSIILDRIYKPYPRRYRNSDLLVSITKDSNGNSGIDEINRNEMDDDYETYLAAIQDTISTLSLDKRTIRLPEVTVKAKRNTKEREIYRSRSSSLAYYDVPAVIDEVYDRGDYMNDDIHDLFRRLSSNFVITRPYRYSDNDLLSENNNESKERNNTSSEIKNEVISNIGNEPDGNVYFKNKKVLFVVNYKKTSLGISGYLNYSRLRLAAIKSIYINDKTSIIANYIDPGFSTASTFELALGYGCVVFIETYPEDQIPVAGAKGVRKTRLDGYNAVKDFYKPNNSEPSPEPDPDYRRTLYWNPFVTTDETGSAKIKFFNNNTCKKFSLNAESVTFQGMIGILSQ